jgi:hypothetical protein
MNDTRYRCKECDWRGQRNETSTRPLTGMIQCPVCLPKGFVDTLEEIPDCNLSGPLDEQEGLFGGRYMEYW